VKPVHTCKATELDAVHGKGAIVVTAPVNPKLAPLALKGSNGKYVATTMHDDVSITVIVKFNTEYVPKIYIASFHVAGTKEVDYSFSLGNKHVLSSKGKELSNGVADVNDVFKDGIKADTMHIMAKAKAPEHTVTISNLHFEACTGKDAGTEKHAHLPETHLPAAGAHGTTTHAPPAHVGAPAHAAAPHPIPAQPDHSSCKKEKLNAVSHKESMKVHSAVNSKSVHLALKQSGGQFEAKTENSNTAETVVIEFTSRFKPLISLIAFDASHIQSLSYILTADNHVTLKSMNKAIVGKTSIVLDTIPKGVYADKMYIEMKSSEKDLSVILKNLEITA